MLYCLSFVNRLLLHSLLANLVLSICQERDQTIQSQLDYYSKRQKFQKNNATDKVDVSAPPKSNGLQNSPGVHCIFFFFFPCKEWLLVVLISGYLCIGVINSILFLYYY